MKAFLPGARTTRPTPLVFDNVPAGVAVNKSDLPRPIHIPVIGSDPGVREI
ncbi:hypothetical protein KDH_68790 [Dictyobacter sp. S3.2.2.5]|uniref:Uncharacterized protein n=1 Tax=Dictyobacter halimunensis TaxID=3026934 RepID=A0ABQ6G2F6_9CHLR|nr:hypothetical protein KDH_68790 [Dictyobacter sp. S3.2.2.5]